MTKKEIVQTIADETQIDHVIVKDIVQRCLNAMVDIVATKGRLELRNFGVFQVKRRAARKARNPRTTRKSMFRRRWSLPSRPARTSPNVFSYPKADRPPAPRDFAVDRRCGRQ